MIACIRVKSLEDTGVAVTKAIFFLKTDTAGKKIISRSMCIERMKKNPSDSGAATQNKCWVAAGSFSPEGDAEVFFQSLILYYFQVAVLIDLICEARCYH